MGRDNRCHLTTDVSDPLFVPWRKSYCSRKESTQKRRPDSWSSVYPHHLSGDLQYSENLVALARAPRNSESIRGAFSQDCVRPNSSSK